METQEEVNRRLREMITRDEKMIAEGKLRRPPSYAAEDFSKEELERARNREALLFLNMEFFNGCDLRCAYCFNDFDTVDECEIHDGVEVRRKPSSRKSLSFEELKDVINQAKKLGARTISLIGGGEPLLYKGFFDLVGHVRSQHMNPWTFTNGTRISQDVAKRLYDGGVTTIVKLNSLRPEVHDKMVGKEGAYERTMEGIGNMLRAGYARDREHQMGLESVVLKDNYADITNLWRYARNHGMIPYIERTVGCNLKFPRDQIPTVPDLKYLWEELLGIDQNEYGFTWPLLPLIASDHCSSNDMGAYITLEGDVRPCGGTPIVLGNVREKPLASMLKESDVLAKIREIRDNHEGFCGNCEYAREYNCSGCRGYAFAVTGDALADDPACFHNPSNLK